MQSEFDVFSGDGFEAHVLREELASEVTTYARNTIRVRPSA
jgi:hypothetical protein